VYVHITHPIHTFIRVNLSDGDENESQGNIDPRGGGGAVNDPMNAVQTSQQDTAEGESIP